MTLYVVGLLTMRFLLTAIFFLVLYKVIKLIKMKIKRTDKVQENSGMIILKERLASGEIDEAKYRDMAAVLKSS